MPETPHLIVPVGTQVVALIDFKDRDGSVRIPKGAVGVVIAAPTDNFHSYRLRFPDGKEGNYLRRELAIRKHFQKEGMELPDGLEDRELDPYVVYRCIVGSRAYGLEHNESDTDIRGIYLPPAELHWSLYGVPEQLENPDREECFWEMQKFLVMALKANPNILECLYTPLVEFAAPIAEELLDIRSIFLSRLVFQTYNGYVLSQFRKLEQDLRAKGEIKWKHAMHLIRLLLQGKSILETGELQVRAERHRDELLEIRHALWTWERVDAWRMALHKEFESAFATTRLSERPDYRRANDFLIHARRLMAGGKKR
jgi:predicted nucleotidyltransferase